MAERKDMVISVEEFPSNSFSENKPKPKKVEKGHERKVEQITVGKISKKKKSLGRKVTETIFDEDSKSVGQYILWDVLIPAAKSTISDVVSNGIEMLLYGGERTRGNRTSRDRGRSYVSYSSYYEDDRREHYKRNRRARQAQHDFDDVLFDSRNDAEAVLSRMLDVLDEYDDISVADFYDMVGVDSVYTDRDWGWENLSSAYVERIRDGYIIRLPRAIALNN